MALAMVGWPVVLEPVASAKRLMDALHFKVFSYPTFRNEFRLVRLIP